MKKVPEVTNIFPIPSYFTHRIELCTDTDACLEKLWSWIDASKKYIIICMYSVDDSQLVKHTYEKIREAALRGVKVLIMIDGLRNDTTKEMRKMLTDVDCELLTLNSAKHIPYFLMNKETEWIFNRHHEKIVVIDDNCLLGSGNLRMEYGGKLYGLGLFRDIFVFIQNIDLHKLLSYLKFVSNNPPNFPVSFPLSQKKTKTNNLSEEEKFEFLFNCPGGIQEIHDRVVQMIKLAKTHISIVQPYYQEIPSIDYEIRQALKRGVKVDFYTARDRDIRVLKYIPNYLLFQNLIRAGCDVYENQISFLHMKLYLVDNKFLTLGSFNHDTASIYVNYEANIYLSTTDQSAEIITKINYLLEILKSESKIINNIKPKNLFYSLKDQISFLFWTKSLAVGLKSIIFCSRKNVPQFKYP